MQAILLPVERTEGIDLVCVNYDQVKELIDSTHFNQKYTEVLVAESLASEGAVSSAGRNVSIRVEASLSSCE